MAVVGDSEICPFCQLPPLLKDAQPIYSSEDVLPYLEHFRDKKQEYFVCLTLDMRRRLITRRIVTIGTLTSSLVHAREVFAGGISDRADSIIVAHNHPSKDPTPSAADIDVTRRLIASGRLLQIPVRDHIIVAEDGHYSFKEEQALEGKGG